MAVKIFSQRVFKMDYFPQTYIKTEMEGRCIKQSEIDMGTKDFAEKIHKCRESIQSPAPYDREAKFLSTKLSLS